MEAKNLILFIALLAAPSLISAQNNINCVFQVNGPHYDCTLNGLFVADNEQTVFTIGGQHQPGRNNAGVTRVIITNSFVPFVITQFFSTFVNLQQYHYTDSTVITRVQNNAFQTATNLQEINIARTTGLTLFPNSFTGVANLQRLFLPNNFINNIHAGLLAGLGNIQAIELNNNQITSIPEIFLRGQPQLTTINLNNNGLARLPNTLLHTNPALISFHAQANQITQIGRRFLETVGSLNSLQLLGNQCINQNWANIGIAGGPTKDAINQALQSCFNNYVGGGDWQNFGFQLRGNVRLYDEDRNLVGQLSG